MHQMYKTGFSNYAGQLENCLSKQQSNNPNCQNKRFNSNKFNKRKTIKSISADKMDKESNQFKNRIKHRSNNDLLLSASFNTGSTFKCTSFKSTSLTKLKKLTTFNKMILITLIYCILNCPNVNCQFFGSQPRPPISNNLVSNSFDSSSPNEVNSIELFVHENARSHHTSDYEIIDGINPPLVIRRSDVFVIGIKFRKPYDPRRDKVRLEFFFGKCVF